MARKRILPARFSDKKTAVMLAAILFTSIAALAAPASQPILAAPIIHMQDTTSSSGQNMWAGRPVHAEFVTPASSLVGKQIDAMVVKIKKAGLPTGNAEIGVFNSDLSVKKLFATKDVSTLTGSYEEYEFTLSGPPYTIAAGGPDRGEIFWRHQLCQHFHHARHRPR